jgi:hypothetical protein|tara:strand:- start:68 stop:526 length:459 start_codon:yes stop_codon:yes gene_type:complete
MLTFLKTAIKYIVGVYVVKFFFHIILFFLIIYFSDFSSPAYQLPATDVQKSEVKKSEVKKSDFILSDVKAKWIGGRFRVIGDVTNIGTIPAGVQLQAKALDSYGETVDVKKYWPHSTDNLDPNDSIDIGFTITKDKSAVDVEVKVISVRIWQ